MSKPIVAIVGRPNVGKSALLNRLIRSREAIVEGTPGVTRDRIYRDTTWNGKDFTLVDTGGILLSDPDTFKQLIRLQVEAAIDEAEIILFVLDIREGLNPMDQDVADLLRNTRKKIVVVANKADNSEMAANISEYYSLGMGEPLAVSSIHGTGTGDLMDIIAKNLPEQQPEEEDLEDPIRISIVGRPNVGKSSLVNFILGEERSIVTDIPGTTRDAVDSAFEWGGKKFVIVDTAGLRRKSKVYENIEYYSNQRAIESIKNSHLGVLMLDASDPAVLQDRRIGGMLDENGKGVIIIVNKWDLINSNFSGGDNQEIQEAYIKKLRGEAEFLSYAPIIFTSALMGKGIKNVLPTVLKVYSESMKKIDTAVVNKVFQDAFFFRPPPSYKGDSLKLFYAHQAGTNPPTFILKVNSPKLVHFSYKRYLENQLRRVFTFEGTPVRLIFKK